MEEVQEERFSDGEGRKRCSSDSPEKKREYYLKYKAKNIEKFKKLVKARNERWKKRHLVKCKEQSRIRAQKWRKNNPKKAKAVNERFRANHKDRLRARKTPKERASDLVGTARRTSKKKNLAFDLDKKILQWQLNVEFVK